MIDRTNAYRVSIARLALASASWVQGDHAEQAVIDLLTSLRHFCAARRIDFEGCNSDATDLFRAELDARAP